MTLAVRLDALEAALLAASPPAGGPAQRTAADYGYKSKSTGRKVATQAGVKRYGLPIGTPLGKGKAQNEQDAYNRLMSQNTTADIGRAVRWMSNGDLALTAKAVFSVKTDNERNTAARLALVKELADRGIDPHSLGYDGDYVPLNPKPKKDPTIQAVKKPKASELPDSVDAEKLSDADLDVLTKAGWKGRADDEKEALYAPEEGSGPLDAGSLSDPAKEMLLAQGWKLSSDGTQVVPPKSRVVKEQERLAKAAETAAKAAAKKAEADQKKADAEAEKARKKAEADALRDRLAAEELASVGKR